jgi:hypothetical protein
MLLIVFLQRSLSYTVESELIHSPLLFTKWTVETFSTILVGPDPVQS